jgi:hypothetical protein
MYAKYQVGHPRWLRDGAGRRLPPGAGRRLPLCAVPRTGPQGAIWPVAQLDLTATRRRQP